MRSLVVNIQHLVSALVRFENWELSNSQLGCLCGPKISNDNRKETQKQHTPYGLSVMVLCTPVVHVVFVGGDAANVSPASGQSIMQAVTFIDSGGSPESNTGEGSIPDLGGLLKN